MIAVWILCAAVAQFVATASEELSPPDATQDRLAFFAASGTSDGSVVVSARVVGRVERVDATRVVVEEPVEGRRVEYSRCELAGLAFAPRESSFDAERALSARATFSRDYVWLRNGDEFPCRLVLIDRRRATVDAFGLQFAIPRGRIRAFSFGARAEETTRDAPAFSPQR